MKLKESDIVSVWMNYAIGEVFYWRGNRIEIIYPGRTSNNGGCDFNDAVFKYNRMLITGDVEVHIKASYWNSHRHCNDYRYNNISLHVVMFDDTHSITVAKNGRYIPVISIKELVERACKISSPLKRYVSEKRFECPVIKDVSYPALLKKSLTDAGENKLKIKAAGYYGRLKTDNPEQILFSGIARCLGYEKNAIPFERLASYLPVNMLKGLSNTSIISAMAAIIGTAGLLPSQSGRAGILASIFSENHLNYMEHLWYRNRLPRMMDESDWCFFRIRPLNHPIIRLLALSGLIHRYRKIDMVDSLTDLTLNITHGNVSIIENELFIDRMLPGVQSVYTSGATLGKCKIREIIVNAILPFMYAYGIYRGDKKLSNKAIGLFYGFPGLQDNYILSYMRQRLMLKNGNRLSSAEQQGLIYIFKQYCRYKDCQRCSLLN